MRVSLGAVVLAACIGAEFGSASGTEMSHAGIVVHIKDLKYAPTPVKVHVGDTVSFVNDDAEAHTITASDKAFDSEGLDSSGTWKHTFAKPGTFAYFCELHPYMKGTIVVLPAVKTQ